jgi:hypothetical protein
VHGFDKLPAVAADAAHTGTGSLNDHEVFAAREQAHPKQRRPNAREVNALPKYPRRRGRPRWDHQKVGAPAKTNRAQPRRAFAPSGVSLRRRRSACSNPIQNRIRPSLSLHFGDETDAASGQSLGQRGCEIEIPHGCDLPFPGKSVDQPLRRVSESAVGR